MARDSQSTASRKTRTLRPLSNPGPPMALARPLSSKSSNLQEAKPAEGMPPRTKGSNALELVQESETNQDPQPKQAKDIFSPMHRLSSSEARQRPTQTPPARSRATRSLLPASSTPRSRRAKLVRRVAMTALSSNQRARTP